MFGYFFCPLCGLPDTVSVTMRVNYSGSIYRVTVCEACADRVDISDAIKAYIDLHPYMHPEVKRI